SQEGERDAQCAAPPASGHREKPRAKRPDTPVDSRPTAEITSGEAPVLADATPEATGITRALPIIARCSACAYTCCNAHEARPPDHPVVRRPDRAASGLARPADARIVLHRFQNLVRTHLAQLRGDRPAVPERINDQAVAVAPEHVGHGHLH